MLIPLADLSDPRVNDFTRLKDVNLRKSFEAEHGLYLAESFSVISRALAAGHQPRAVLTSAHWLGRLQEILGTRASEIPIFVAEEKQLIQLTGFSMHRGAIAAMERPALPELDEVLAAAQAVLILEDLVDHTNV
ncbi:MAG: rRNA methyltransferase, partial [Varibaculum cambriense]|nr:rRNA methyltransferase [Varibaculum cambriense]